MLLVDKNGFITTKSDARPTKEVAQETYDYTCDAIKVLRNETPRNEEAIELLQWIGANMIEIGAKPKRREAAND